jgi:adenylate kinase family enzyme
MGLTEIIDVRAVVRLSCSPEVVFERIRIDTGGDRKGREDDRSEAIRHRIEVFEERTRPLLDYYAAQGVPIEIFNVGPETTAVEIQSQIEQRDMCAATGNS